MSEQERYEARIEKQRAEGLVDIKYFVEPDHGMSSEDFYGAANRIEDALDNNQFEESECWNEDLEPQPSAV